MLASRKSLLRLAVCIHQRFANTASDQESIELPISTWHDAQRVAHRIRLARQHGWQLAAVRLTNQLARRLDVLRCETSDLMEGLTSRTPEPSSVAVDEIYCDLTALHEEFPTVGWSLREKTLSVTTEPIQLDGIYLGPFEIRLEWSGLANGHPYNYRVIALDAHPAASNDSVAHPHVQDEVVCEGEARQPIRQALEQGRLLDFFLIVASLLRTYNSGSPYVPLSDWNGVECTDCGSTVCDDERWTCEKCETTVCGECYFNCPGCDGIFCNECVTCCEGCDENHCGTCMKHCSRCRAELCQACLDNKERCSDCHDQEPEETSEKLVVAG